MSCGIGSGHHSDLVLLWLWCGLAATALIRPLAWELPYATGAALKKKKKKKTRKNHLIEAQTSLLQGLSLKKGVKENMCSNGLKQTQA